MALNFNLVARMAANSSQQVRWGLCHLLSPGQIVIQIPRATSVTVYERDRKAGYDTAIDMSTWQHIKNGLRGLGSELRLFSQEIQEKLQCSALNDRRHLDYEYIWKCNSEDDVHKWIVTSDQDHGEGSSTAHFVLNGKNNGLFYGNLSTDVPKDGIIKRAGYCNIRSPRHMKSFKRSCSLDLTRYTHLLMRVRGDGRTYMLNFQMDMTFDISWNVMSNFALYTRGGPYWQVAKIPFSRFYESFKGRIQDKQNFLRTNRIGTFGITIGDGNPGPFHLEIDYIAAVYDENHNEEFAYEMYETKSAHIGT